jgi:ribonuclease HI
MEHILLRCERSEQAEAWALAQKMCTQKGIKWPDYMQLGMILACRLTSFPPKQKQGRSGKDQFFMKLVSETASEVWNMRCKRLLNREPDEPERTFSSSKIQSHIAQRPNTCIVIDRQLTDTRRYGRKAIPRTIVLATWGSVLQNESSFPPDWTRWRGGVLVGIMPKRKRHRDPP